MIPIVHKKLLFKWIFSVNPGTPKGLQKSSVDIQG